VTAPEGIHSSGASRSPTCCPGAREICGLCRADLTELEQGEHLLKRKEIYEWWHPETKQHVAGAAAANATMGRTVATANLSFATDTAAKTGIDDRTIRRSNSEKTSGSATVVSGPIRTPVQPPDR
jgi:hypothetical protein